MTRNIFMAFLFTIASVVVLFLVWFQETTRLPEANATALATKLEFGQRNYEEYCARCHGLDGSNISALPLNDLQERHGPDSESFTKTNGIKQKYGTLRNYVESRIAGGVPGTFMPAWSVEYGGPMRPDQIEAVTEYVMSLQGGTLTAAAATSGASYKATVLTQVVPVGPTATLDPGMSEAARRGMEVFNTVCQACHSTGTDKKVGPGLQALFKPGGPPGAPYGENLPNGNPINDENVKQWIITGGTGQISTMPPMGASMSDDQINDVVEYLKTL